MRGRSGLRQPEKRNTLGYALWLILKSDDVGNAVHGQRLGIAAARLSSIVHGNSAVSQQFMREHKWPEALAKHYPQGWAEHSAQFTAQAAQASESRGRNANTPPRAKTSARHAFRRTASAATTGAVAASTGGDERPAYVEVFEETSQQKAARAAAKDWRIAAGQAIASVVTRRGDDAEAIAAETNSHALRKSWQRVLDADPTLASSVYKEAIKTVTGLYHLEFSKDQTDNQSAKALAKLFDACPV